MRNFLLLIMCTFYSLAIGQNIAIKSNLLYDITTNINLGTEFKLSNNFTLEVSATYNPWQFSNNKKFKHILIQPEARYWLCERFYGHFIGTHLHYARYNVGGIKELGLRKYRYQGNLYGAGFSYGYHHIINNRWILETSIGIGYAHLDYSKYYCYKCGEKIKDDRKNYFGPTKVSISLIYIIK